MSNGFQDVRCSLIIGKDKKYFSNTQFFFSEISGGEASLEKEEIIYW